MRALTVIMFAAAAAAAGAAPPPDLSGYGVQPDSMHDAVFVRLTDKKPRLPMVPSSLKSLDGAGRAAAVKAIGAAIKAYVGSEDFQTRFDAWHTAQCGAPPKKPAPRSEAKNAENETAFRDRVKNTQMPAGEREQANAEVEQMAHDGKLKGDPKAWDDSDRQRYKDEERTHREHCRGIPESPNALVKKALKQFLAGTAGVPAHTRLATVGDKQVFVSDAYEAKPVLWKLAYRAGPEATQAARGMAQAWLTHLK